jgi:hypothetical protein
MENEFWKQYNYVIKNKLVNDEEYLNILTKFLETCILLSNKGSVQTAFVYYKLKEIYPDEEDEHLIEQLLDIKKNPFNN